MQPGHWLSGVEPVDRHAVLRAEFTLEQDGVVVLALLGAHWFKVWLDGEFLTDGPHRFADCQPEYETFTKPLSAGRHVLAWHVHAMGVTTRLIGDWVPAFAWAQVVCDGAAVELQWSGKALEAYHPTHRRLDCVLGWVEWCDRRLLPPDSWKDASFSDPDWKPLEDVKLPGRTPRDAGLAAMQRRSVRPREVGKGELVNMSIIEHDPTSGFFIRELEDHTLPTQGIWARYDLGRVRLGYARLSVSAPQGTVVQIAYAESLTFGRVHPYVKTGGGTDSCMLDHWVCKGGGEMLIPLHPKGARFVEVHLISETANDLAITDFTFEERAYFSTDSEGSFKSSDELLDRIWYTGRDTLVACSEDTITDNPHRERGQWLGETVGPALALVSACFSDWRILRRSLEQAALCVLENGLLPAVYPGTKHIIPSFSVQWPKAMLDYYRHTGDRSLLDSLYSVAERSLRALEPEATADGLKLNPEYWNFVDWGYRGANTVFHRNARDSTDVDPALSLWYLEAIRHMVEWSRWIGKDARPWELQAKGIAAGLSSRIDAIAEAGNWEAYGYHATVLSLRLGLVQEESIKDAVGYTKKFLLSCFPNDPTAPRLYGVTLEHDRVMTPYFLHFAYPALVAHGEAAFVLDQIRVCWGWMLDGGYTTWPEVFDPRWSHCHHWSATPTWLLPRCLLGLTPAFDRGVRHYEWSFQPGHETKAAGSIPLPTLDGTPGQKIDISWVKKGEGLYDFRIVSPEPLIIHSGGAKLEVHGECCFDATRERQEGSFNFRTTQALSNK